MMQQPIQSLKMQATGPSSTLLVWLPTPMRRPTRLRTASRTTTVVASQSMANSGVVTVAGAINREADGPSRNITSGLLRLTVRSPIKSFQLPSSMLMNLPLRLRQIRTQRQTRSMKRDYRYCGWHYRFVKRLRCYDQYGNVQPLR